MKKLQVGGGRVSLVDDADYDWLSQWRWTSYKATKANPWYVTRRENGVAISLHRQIMGFPEGLDVDHIDGDGLNNCRANLRVCSRSGNMKNRPAFRKRAFGASKYKGVYAKDGRWQVSLNSDGRRHHGGTFACELTAARAYDDLAKKHHGEFARLNFPESDRATSAWAALRAFVRRAVARATTIRTLRET